MAEELRCARCARPIYSRDGIRFVRTGDATGSRIEHLTCPTPPAEPAPGGTSRSRETDE